MEITINRPLGFKIGLEEKTFQKGKHVVPDSIAEDWFFNSALKEGWIEITKQPSAEKVENPTEKDAKPSAEVEKFPADKKPK